MQRYDPGVVYSTPVDVYRDYRYRPVRWDDHSDVVTTGLVSFGVGVLVGGAPEHHHGWFGGAEPAPAWHRWGCNNWGWTGTRRRPHRITWSTRTWSTRTMSMHYAPPSSTTERPISMHVRMCIRISVTGSTRPLRLRPLQAFRRPALLWRGRRLCRPRRPIRVHSARFPAPLRQRPRPPSFIARPTTRICQRRISTRRCCSRGVRWRCMPRRRRMQRQWQLCRIRCGKCRLRCMRLVCKRRHPYRARP